jgi:hypothetical protein
MLEEIVAAETISWLMNSLLHCFCLNLLPTRNPRAGIFCFRLHEAPFFAVSRFVSHIPESKIYFYLVYSLRVGWLCLYLYPRSLTCDSSRNN